MPNRVAARCAVAAFLAAASAALAAPLRVSFVRTLPARHDLGNAERLAIIYLIGDNERVTTFLDVFVQQANQSGTLRVEDATDGGQRIFAPADEQSLERLRRVFPADLYLGVSRFTCTLRRGEGEGSTRTIDGERTMRRHAWADALCSARVEALDSLSGKRLFAFHVRGEGTSPRAIEITDEERDIAVTQAARYAAIAAAEELVPRRVRETFELDEAAPGTEDVAPLIEAERYAAARDWWRAMLPKHAGSAALHYNLGTLAEALGDLDAADDHLAKAHALAPEQKRYRVALDLFRKRNQAAVGKRSRAVQ